MVIGHPLMALAVGAAVGSAVVPAGGLAVEKQALCADPHFCLSIQIAFASRQVLGASGQNDLSCAPSYRGRWAGLQAPPMKIDLATIAAIAT
jgi:hypothetical protein